MEDYKKKYEEALERMKSWVRGEHPECFTEARKTAEFIFPELAESEDERIKKEIKSFLKISIERNSLPIALYDSWIAWLERQGEQNLLARQYLVSKGYPVNTGGDIPTYEELYEIIKEGIINVDKCEPKFKVGDWITDNNSTFQIVRVENEWYYTDDGDKICFDVAHQYYRLWTIEDAKSGDVLATKSGKPFVFKDFSDVKHSNAPTAYCGIDTLDNFIIGSNKHWWTDEEVHPAAKEQRDLLFQKMKEAGYKWENNQLEEINNKGVVDLGLPSGTLWAKCNLGAEKETDFGKFFQWGDTQGYSGVDEHRFGWGDYRYGSSKNFTKYNENDTKLILDNEDDPVFVATKGKFKSPTKEQLKELIAHTNHEWTIIDGVNGMKFWKMGTEEPTDSDSYIFIPAAGYCYDGSHNDVGSFGCVWSSSYNESFASRAWSMCFNAGDAGDIYVSDSSRCNGFSVRGVLN